MKKKTPAKTTTRKIRVPLPERKTMMLEVSQTRILKASVGKTTLEIRGPIPKRDLKVTLNGKEITYISSDATIVMMSSVPGQICTLKYYNGKPYWICNPPFPPC